MNQNPVSTEIGVFLPVISGGWIKSTNSPALTGSYSSNLAIALAAEEMGFDFAMSPATWRGYGGDSIDVGYSRGKQNPNCNCDPDPKNRSKPFTGGSRA